MHDVVVPETERERARSFEQRVDVGGGEGTRGALEDQIEVVEPRQLFTTA